MRTRLARCLALTLALAAGLVSAACAADWPQWRGPNRDGVSAETGLLQDWPQGGPKLLWKVPGVGRGYSSVAVADGRIFTVGDRKTGKSGDCLAIAVSARDGKELWATRLAPAQGDGPRCTPTVDGDRVYALSRQGELACLDAATGKTLWRVSYKNDLGGRMMSGWDYSESPLVDGDRLICTPGGDDAALVALDKRTGKVIWKAAVPQARGAGYASVVTAEVGGVKQYLTLLGSGLVGVEAREGKLLWRYKRIANGTANIPTAIVKGDLVFTSTGYGTGAALLKLVPSQDGGVEAKEQYFLSGKKLQNHHGGVVLIGDYVYGGHGHNNGLPFCLNLRTGQLMWGPERGVGTGSAAVVYADGRLYYRYESGSMALVEATPQGYRLHGSFELPRDVGTPSWPHPVVANGCLYVRGNNVLLCYDVKQK